MYVQVYIHTLVLYPSKNKKKLFAFQLLTVICRNNFVLRKKAVAANTKVCQYPNSNLFSVPRLCDDDSVVDIFN